MGRIEQRDIQWFGHLIRMPESESSNGFHWEKKSEKGRGAIGMS